MSDPGSDRFSQSDILGSRSLQGLSTGGDRLTRQGDGEPELVVEAGDGADVASQEPCRTSRLLCFCHASCPRLPARFRRWSLHGFPEVHHVGESPLPLLLGFTLTVEQGVAAATWYYSADSWQEQLLETASCKSRCNYARQVRRGVDNLKSERGLAVDTSNVDLPLSGRCLDQDRPWRGGGVVIIQALCELNRVMKAWQDAAA